MTYRKLGKSDLQIYPIALGSMQFGWTTDEETAFSIMDCFAEAGGNLIDTADMYCNWVKGCEGGESEALIGRWMKTRNNRDKTIIATKVRGAMGYMGQEGRKHELQREGLSRKWIMQACEDSLKRLQTDHIDLYQVHWVDNQVPIEETLGALTELVKKGYVRYIGCSSFSSWRLMQALWASDKHDLESFISLQPEYSIASPVREAFERELAKVCQTYDLGVIPYSPLSEGFLTGKYQQEEALPKVRRAKSVRNRFFNDKNWVILSKLRELAQEHNAHVAQIALAWTLSKPFITAPIVGVNNIEQLKDLLPAVDIKLSEEDLKKLNKLSSWNFHRTELEK